MSAKPDESLEIQGEVLKNIRIEKLSMVILVDAELPDKKESLDSVTPRLTLTSPEYGLEDAELLMGLVNERLFLLMDGEQDGNASYIWRGAASSGLIPPGNYSFNLRLLVLPGESTLYDGFRLFLVELEGVH
jgi:hypothetical protein